MYNEKIFLTPQEILDKEFKIDARGYRPQEVDKFLDLVIRDYTEFLTTIKKLDKDIRDLTEDNVKLKQEMRKLKTNLEAATDNESDNSSRGVNNVDLLRRLSQLEKVVFGKNE
jgi:DivIVA domain-containing protein